MYICIYLTAYHITHLYPFPISAVNIIYDLKHGYNKLPVWLRRIMRNIQQAVGRGFRPIQ